MIRSELIAELATDNPHLKLTDVELIVDTIFDQITEALARGGRVEIRGFGTFDVKQRKARMGRSPRTGEPVPVAAKTTLFFRAGARMLRRLNRPPASTKPT